MLLILAVLAEKEDVRAVWPIRFAAKSWPTLKLFVDPARIEVVFQRALEKEESCA